jgi:peptidoglycan/LPS O-acetylase OafA/YrhL
MPEDVFSTTGAGRIDSEAAPLRHDIRQLTGLRGIMALDVVLSHYGLGNIGDMRMFTFGNAAVDVFFCLSSFTLCLVYGAGLGQRLEVSRYAVARVARVYPLFLITTLVTLLYSLAWAVGEFPTASIQTLTTQFIRQALLLGSIPLPFLGKMGSWNDSAWSISIEAFCYVLVFPPLFYLTRRATRLQPGTIGLWMLLLGAASFVIFEKLFDATVDGPFYPPPVDALSAWVPLARGVLMFGAGWLAYVIYLRWKEATSFIGAMTNALAIAFLGIVASEKFGLMPSASVVMIAPFLVLGLMNGRSLTAQILASPIIHFLGVISYSLYLWHLPMKFVAWRIWHWPDGVHPILAILWPLAVTLIASALSFFLLEMPARRAIRAHFEPRRGGSVARAR